VGRRELQEGGPLRVEDLEDPLSGKARGAHPTISNQNLGQLHLLIDQLHQISW